MRLLSAINGRVFLIRLPSIECSYIAFSECFIFITEVDIFHVTYNLETLQLGVVNKISMEQYSSLTLFSKKVYQ